MFDIEQPGERGHGGQCSGLSLAPLAASLQWRTRPVFRMQRIAGNLLCVAAGVITVQRIGRMVGARPGEAKRGKADCKQLAVPLHQPGRQGAGPWPAQRRPVLDEQVAPAGQVHQRLEALAGPRVQLDDPLAGVQRVRRARGRLCWRPDHHHLRTETGERMAAVFPGQPAGDFNHPPSSQRRGKDTLRSAGCGRRPWRGCLRVAGRVQRHGITLQGRLVRCRTRATCASRRHGWRRRRSSCPP